MALALTGGTNGTVLIEGGKIVAEVPAGR